MKSMMKILLRYVLSAAGVALILLVINFIVLVTWTIQNSNIVPTDYAISDLAKGLRKSEVGYTLSEEANETIKKHFQWAMLLDQEGNVIWEENLPPDLPLKYSLSDVASFTRWYLNDYPVYVWKHPEGLFVLGKDKGSTWKYDMEIPQKLMDNILALLPAILILNGALAVVLALLLGLRLFRALKPLAKGIEDMAEKRPVEFPTHGLLGDLAASINKTSQELIQQEAALNKRDNARTAWVAGVSHDIRTPLSIMMGYASQLEEDPDLPQSKREKAAIIRRQSERIKTLVNDLNLASKLEYSMQPLRLTSVAVAPLLRDVIVDFLNSGLSDSYTIQLNINEKAQNTYVLGDEELLRRAVANLISNSIKHNPKGCTITVQLEKTLNNSILTVSDNGKGFPPDILKNLNNPLDSSETQSSGQQSGEHKSSTHQSGEHKSNAHQSGEHQSSEHQSSEHQSHGLGLTIVRQIIKSHGGITEFQNLPEGGCKVLLQMPVHS